MKKNTRLVNAEMRHIAESITFLQALKLLVKTYINQFKNRYKQDYRNSFSILFLATNEENERLKQIAETEHFHRVIKSKKYIDHLREVLEGGSNDNK